MRPVRRRRRGGDDHHPLLAEVRLGEGVKRGVGGDPAETPTNDEGAGLQSVVLAGQVEVAPAIDAALEVLAVVTHADCRVQPAAQPGRAQAHPQDQRVRRACALGQVDAAAGQVERPLGRTSREGVAVVIARGVEQVVGEPGLMGDPAQHQGQRHQPPGHADAQCHQQDEGHQQRDALLPAVAFQQLLLASAHGFTPGRRARGGTSGPCIRGRHAQRSSAAACPGRGPRPRRPGC